MVATMVVICLFTSAVLGAVYVITLKPIQNAQIAKTNAAIAQVTPAFDNNPVADSLRLNYTYDGKTRSTVAYIAKKGGKIVGYAIEASTMKGFGGRINLMVGFKPDGEIYNSSVISHSETPGLGARITDSQSHFVVQFNGKIPDDKDFKVAVRKDGGDVDAITASTISSRAFCDVIRDAYGAFKSINVNSNNSGKEAQIDSNE
jgi:electron transport complex protein RnfG